MQQSMYFTNNLVIASMKVKIQAASQNQAGFSVGHCLNEIQAYVLGINWSLQLHLAQTWTEFIHKPLCII